MSTNPIALDMDSENAAAARATVATGPISTLAAHYMTESDRLLGFVLSLSYEDLRFVTCDPWKRNCGGVPRNSFILVKLGESAVSQEDRIFCGRLILARVTESVPTPVETEVQNTVFQIHKLQPIVDPITQKELQWSALKASILGTYYDTAGGDEHEIGFGNDVDSYFRLWFTKSMFPPTRTSKRSSIASWRGPGRRSHPEPFVQQRRSNCV